MIHAAALWTEKTASVPPQFSLFATRAKPPVISRSTTKPYQDFTYWTYTCKLPELGRKLWFDTLNHESPKWVELLLGRRCKTKDQEWQRCSLQVPLAVHLQCDRVAEVIVQTRMVVLMPSWSMLPLWQFHVPSINIYLTQCWHFKEWSSIIVLPWLLVLYQTLDWYHFFSIPFRYI